MKRQLFFYILIILFANSTVAQVKPIKTARYYPKDSVRFNKNSLDFDYNFEKERYGKTTMIVHCESVLGYFEFVFKKKINILSRSILYNEGGVCEKYNPKTHQWEHEDGTWEHSDMKSKPQDTIVYSDHNLYALVLLHDHNGVIEKVKFQDFGNAVYWPEFDYPNCSISDENKDGSPEFYLSYIGLSDGLDAKPYKQIIYTIPDNSKGKYFEKSKATAFYPSGNETDVYTIEYETNWNSLPQNIKIKSKQILKLHKKSY